MHSIGAAMREGADASERTRKERKRGGTAYAYMHIYSIYYRYIHAHTIIDVCMIQSAKNDSFSVDWFADGRSCIGSGAKNAVAKAW